MSSLVGLLGRMIFRPASAFRELQSAPENTGARAAVLTGSIWALFLIALALGGHAPSGPLVLPISRDRYYLFEAVVSIPLRLLMFWSAARVMNGLLRRSGRNAAVQNGLGSSMFVSSVVGWWLPEIIVFVAAGFSALPAAMRVYVPISLVWGLALLTRYLKSTCDLTAGRAFAIGLAGFVTYYGVGSPILR